MPFIAILALTLPLAGAPKQYGYPVEKALLTALNNERQAAARYDACAEEADQEGYPGAAMLFRACAKAERIHAARFEKALTRGGIDVPPNNASRPSVWSTEDNLREAAAAEQRERDGTYKDALEAARSARDSEITKLFDVTRDAETEHGNLCATAARQLDQLRSPHTYYVCKACGYVTDFAMGLCPLCREQQALEEVE